MTIETDIAIHACPVWRERANFILMARLTGGKLEGRFEQLWARQTGPHTFEICCIPFFVYDVNLGDEVEAAVDSENRWVIQGITRTSGHFTFRAWFKGATELARNGVVKDLNQRGCLLEWHSNNLLGIDATSKSVAQVVANLLAEHEQAGRLQYEAGRTY